MKKAPKPFSHLRQALAGCQLAAMNIPQVLGYAKIAGMPVETGLYALLFPLVAFAVLGSSRYLVVSADSATAAILAGGLAPLAAPGSPHYIALAGAVAFLTAIFLLLARVLKLGFLADFLSQTVLVGFLSGVGLQLAITMLGGMLGIEITATGTLGQLSQVLHDIPLAHGPTVLLSAVIVGGIFVLTRWLPRTPAPMFAVVGSIFASRYGDFAAHGIKVLGTVSGGLPHFTWPAFPYHEIEILLPLAASCGVMILAQSAATARSYALRHHDELDENADLVGLAAANLAASLTGGFVVNGSPSQTAMVESSGGRRPWAHVATALVVALVLLFLTGPLQFLPRAALNSIVFLLGLRLVDWRALRGIRRESPGEFGLALLTVGIVIVFGVEEGILLAMVCSMLRIIWHNYHPHTGVLFFQNGWVLNPPVPGFVSEPGLVIYRFGASLFYANAGRFAEDIRVLVEGGPSSVRWLVIDAEAISQVDYSAARVILDLQRELAENGVTMAFARVLPFLRADLDRHHVTEAVGAAKFFPHLKDAREAFLKAI